MKKADSRRNSNAESEKEIGGSETKKRKKGWKPTQLTGPPPPESGNRIKEKEKEQDRPIGNKQQIRTDPNRNEAAKQNGSRTNPGKAGSCNRAFEHKAFSLSDP